MARALTTCEGLISWIIPGVQAPPNSGHEPQSALTARSAIEIGLRSRVVRAALALASIALTIYIVERVYAFGQSLSSILSTVAGAWLLAMLAQPLINFFQFGHIPDFTARARSAVSAPRAALKLSLPFSVSVALAYLLLLIFLIGLTFVAAATVIPQAADFIVRLPEIAANLPGQTQAALTDAFGRFGVSLADLPPLLSPAEASSQLRTLAGVIASQTLAFATSTAGFLGQLLFALILSAYMTLEGRTVTKQFFQVLPRGAQPTVRAFIGAIGRAFAGYLNSMVLAALLQGLFTALLFSVFGVQFGFVVGIVFAALTFIPLVGAPIGVLIAVAVALFFKPGAALIIGIVLFALNQVFSFGVLPRLLKNTVGVPGLVQLVAVSVGTQLFGFWGLVFSVPMAGAIYAVVFDFYLPRRRSREAAEGAVDTELFDAESPSSSTSPARPPEPRPRLDAGPEPSAHPSR